MHSKPFHSIVWFPFYATVQQNLTGILIRPYQSKVHVKPTWKCHVPTLFKNIFYYHDLLNNVILHLLGGWWESRSQRNKKGSTVIIQKRVEWYNIRINCENNHVGSLIIQILITTVLAQLVQNTRLMLGLGGYSASVHKWEASVAKWWSDRKCQLTSCEVNNALKKQIWANTMI